jgi:superfamily II DNA or RNA helicase
MVAEKPDRAVPVEQTDIARIIMNTNEKKRQGTRTLSPPAGARLSRTHKPDDLGLEEWQRLLRKQYGAQQKYRLENLGDHPLFTEFRLHNPETAKTYKIAIRGSAPPDNYCSCPDYAATGLGTCKHIEFVLSRLMKRKGARKAFKEGYTPFYSEVHLRYGLKRQVAFRPGTGAPPELLSLAKEYFDGAGILKEDRLSGFNRFLDAIPRDDGHEVRCYDDVLGYIAEHQDAEHRRKLVRSRFKEGIESPVFRNLLKTGLYPYQREGALFAVSAGRCLIGDDMGLGKTVQALAAAELMANLFDIRKVLVVSPTSLKHQWRAEIEAFTGRSVQVIDGLHHQRRELYGQETFFKLINYELVHRDMEPIRRWSPDLIILDEAQRIKNWKTRTAKSVKQLESPFAMVLTGTPLENRIEELHSIVEFIDRWRLGPLFRFVDNHRIVDGDGKLVGYKELQSVRKSLEPVMIRRKKDEVLRQLPERIDKTFFVAMTKEQRVIHDENLDIVARLAAKWRRYKFLCEADQRRLRIALNYMRMAADNTYLVDRKTVHGPKTEELDVLLKEIVLEGKEKVVIFSQWIRMMELVEQVLRRNGIGYVFLHGQVPSRQRKDLTSRFKEDPSCMVFLSTDAGGVGLNLQSGSVVINMDIPWNPAVLEQRIGRVHRLGQRKTVRIVNFVTESSIEERILDLLKFKKSLFAGALDREGDDVVMLGGSLLKRLMQSVETITAGLDKADVKGAQPARSEPEMGDKGAGEGDGNGRKALSDLVTAGAQLLTDLGRTLSRPGPSGGNPIDDLLKSLIHRDGKTDTSYLRIPLPEKEVVTNLFSAFVEIVAGAMGTKIARPR